MDQSSACSNAYMGHYSTQDEQHPLFPLYRQYRFNMQRLMVDSQDFCDWLASYEREKWIDGFTEHPRFKEFQQWMFDNKGGRRNCYPPGIDKENYPRGVVFPMNFVYWLDGGRW